MMNERHLKRLKDTVKARIISVAVLMVMVLLMAFCGRITYADEQDPDPIIVIPDSTDDKDIVSENEGGESQKPEEPIVKINIREPSEWHRKSAKVKFSAEDIADSGDFTVSEVRAKIGSSGSWTDVTDDMFLELSEDCVVYVKVTDTRGRTYSKNKKICCFDSTKPTLNAAVNNGSLTIETNDEDSGVKAVYVNGFEFTDITEGNLNIRMQQFDTGYENFAIQAMDYAGNMSDTYRVRNPYYKAKDASGKEAKILPDSAEPTKPAEAVATVTEHIKTDDSGNALAKVSDNSTSGNESMSDEKKRSLAKADREESGKAETMPGMGKEFYTIEAKSGKVFYLIIDRSGEDEEVHFVTDITENDLLNVTDDNSSILPQNAAMTDSGAAVMDSALPNNNRQIDDIESEEEADLFEENSTDDTLSGDDMTDAEAPEDTGEEKKDNPWAVRIFL
ncbi:MAG: DUF4366 domain-containing protein, partial [Lachnospiraceae bacterium]|nr:DUF4366 domain-containing protein [Lachnospiraceae bacterium]